jgi:putative transcription factor
MSSFCELCGRQLTTDKKVVLIDEIVLNVCSSCSKHGKPYSPPAPANKKVISVKASNPKTRVSLTKRIQMIDDTVLNPEFARLIREARMKKGLTHEQLGRLMNEKATLLRKIETGSLKPDEIFAKKLERYLGIRLYVNIDED